MPFTDAEKASMSHGLPYFQLGKSETFSSFGSRYLVVHDSYQILAAEAASRGVGTIASVYGPAQMEWLVGDDTDPGVLFDTDATWKVFASSVSMTPMVLDFTNPQIAAMLPADFPDELRTRLTLNVDQWDGFPIARQQLLGALAQAGNSVVVSGDIHATFVTDHGNSVFEFTPPAVSSRTFGEMVQSAAAGIPGLAGVDGVDLLLGALATLLQVSSLDDVNVSTSDIVAADTFSHGFGIFEAGADAIDVTIMSIPSTEALTSYYDWPDTLDHLFTSAQYRVQDGQLIPLAGE
jgi:alkaline phosphatase D